MKRYGVTAPARCDSILLSMLRKQDGGKIVEKQQPSLRHRRHSAAVAGMHVAPESVALA